MAGIVLTTPSELALCPNALVSVLLATKRSKNIEDAAESAQLLGRPPLCF